MDNQLVFKRLYFLYISKSKDKFRLSVFENGKQVDGELNPPNGNIIFGLKRNRILGNKEKLPENLLRKFYTLMGYTEYYLGNFEGFNQAYSTNTPEIDLFAFMVTDSGF